MEETRPSRELISKARTRGLRVNEKNKRKERKEGKKKKPKKKLFFQQLKREYREYYFPYYEKRKKKRQMLFELSHKSTYSIFEGTNLQLGFARVEIRHCYLSSTSRCWKGKSRWHERGKERYSEIRVSRLITQFASLFSTTGGGKEGLLSHAMAFLNRSPLSIPSLVLKVNAIRSRFDTRSHKCAQRDPSHLCPVNFTTV